jgi:hypothetical protein
MKEGKTLAELAKQITHEREAKHDFRASTSQLEYDSVGAIAWEVGDKSYRAEPTRHCLRQICERSGIPVKYADKMSGENAPLLSANINWWWQHAPEKRMLRTLLNGESTARAFVSERYRAMDNHDLAEVILPKLADVGCEVLSSQITETRLYIQAATPRMELDLNKLRTSGRKLNEIEPVQAGIVISNSEVGAGALSLSPMLYFLTCFNGAIAARGMHRNHVGRRGDSLFELEEAAEYYSDKTKEMDDRVLWSKVRDVVDGMFTMDGFTSIVQKFAAAGSVRIDAPKAIEEISTRYGLLETEKTSVLNHLIEGGDLSVYGLSSAVTRASTDVESYDRAVELERVGGDIIELPQTIWSNN